MKDVKNEKNGQDLCTGGISGRARNMSGSSSLFFVARPIFLINIYGTYFVKIEKIPVLKITKSARPS